MKTNKALTVLSILLVVVGVLSIVFGILMLAEDHGSTGEGASFGADFYTYVNKNAARTATNTYYLLKVLAKGFGFCLIIAGASLILAGCMKLVSKPQQAVVESGTSAPADRSTDKKDELPEL